MPSRWLTTLVLGTGLVAGLPAHAASLAPNAHVPSCATEHIGARGSHSLAYDPGRRRVLLFGGVSDDPSDPMPSSLWEWDGTAWRCIVPDGPPGRADAFLAFDEARKRLVLFGGRVFEPNRRMRFMRDTWEWDGARWALIDSAGPGPRIHGAIAYDVTRRSVVMHGGGGANASLHDTWEWTGIAWRLVPIESPAGTIGDAMVPSAEGMTFLIATRDSCPSGFRASLFVARGDSLGRLSEPGPCLSPISPASPSPGGILLYNGWNKDEPATSWMWNGRAWQQSDTAPPRRRGTAMAFDAARGRVVLFGGEGEDGLLGDTWEWDGRRWSRVSPAPAR